MAAESDFSVRFWGVRGSIPCPGPDTVTYGGNTPCIEVRCGDRRLVFDAGTGIRALGKKLDGEGTKDVDLFLTHTHIDHLAGLPFFCHAFNPANTLRIWSGHLEDGDTTESVLRQFMSAPLFPVPVDIFGARVSYHDFEAGETLSPAPGIRLRTAPLNHPQNATGYRVEYGGRSICYVTDTEHVEGTQDRNILALIADADIVIYDSMFTEDEYPKFRGWGHSTWQEGARLCAAAGARTFVLFHHLPGRTDGDLSRIGDEARAVFADSVVAREGMTLTP